MDNSRPLAAAAHLSGTVAMLLLPSFGFLGPMLIWMFLGHDRLVAHHAKQAVLFQLVMGLLVWLIGGFASVSCIFFWAGFVAIIPWLAALCLPIYAAIKVGGGASYVYPLTGRLPLDEPRFSR